MPALFARRFPLRRPLGRPFSIPTSTAAASGRVPRSIYRQLLRSCDNTDPKIPLTSFIDPIHLGSPEQVDADRLDSLSQLAKHEGHYDDFYSRAVRRIRELLPYKSEVQNTSMTVPIHSSTDLKHFFQAIFRLNSVETSSNHRKERISAAFKALKALNELSGDLRPKQERREQHMDRENVAYRIGQVIQHKHDRWRGVIVEWDRLDKFASANKTSLTVKDYTSYTHNVRYDILIDEGDAHILGSSSGWSMALQSDLNLVSDSSLTRIRNRLVSDHFTRFSVNSFEPNESLAYDYPIDLAQESLSDLPAHDNLCRLVIEALQELARDLERHILDEIACPSERGLTMLANFQSKLSNISQGNVLPTSFKFARHDPALSSVAAHHLRSILNVSREVMSVVFRRKQAKETKSKLKFALGDIVYHKLFGFRGVIVAWDPKPTIDVSRWDGLQHIEDPMSQPFYHIIPDQGDCVEAFGGERPLRYVCEENIVSCYPDRKLIDVDLEPEWKLNRDGTSYLPPPDLCFKYGDDIEDEGTTERCMAVLLETINRWQLQARSPRKADPLSSVLSMSTMMKLLEVMVTLEDATVVQDTIKEIRNAHLDIDLRYSLDAGMEALMRGEGQEALEIFKSIIDKDPDGYAEAYNKLATCQFMLGQLDESLDATLKTLTIDPEHLQALNGLGLIYIQKGDYSQAVECFQKSVKMDPWSPVSSRLSSCIDAIDSLFERDEHP